MKMKRILFIGHEASRTGAPFALLHFLRWVSVNTNLDFRVLLKSGGDLESEFAKIAPVTVLLPQKKGLLRRGIERVGLCQDLSKTHLVNIKKRMIEKGVDLIYSNTICNAQLLDVLAENGCPVITHVHELEHTIRQLCRPEDIKLIKERTHHFIAVAECVRNNLIKNHGISQDKINLVYEFIPVRTFDRDCQLAIRKRVREELGIPMEALIVGASGTLDWRKGADLFVQLANLIMKQAEGIPVWFVWLGGDINGWFYQQVLHDVKLLGIENRIKFLGQREKSLDYLTAFDVLSLVSREDPFPLVCLEAASLGIPIVYFTQAGGIGEFVGEDAGCAVPYLDLPVMASKVIELLYSLARRIELGRKAAQRVRQQHDVDVVAPRLLEIIQRFV